MSNISFSFIMPAYKREYMEKAIRSITNQSFQEFELIIVDDASPDNIKEVADIFHDPRIIYKRNKKNIGGSNLVANWNYCIQFSKNDYIILATDDDLFETNYLKDAVEMLTKYPNVNILRTGVKIIDEADNICDYEYPLKEFMSCREFTLLWSKGGLHSCISNYIFRRKTLLENGGFIDFPHGHYSDDATVLAMSSSGIACITNANFCFRISSISLSYSSDYHVALSQIEATKSFMIWYTNHLNRIYDSSTNNIIKNNSYEFYRRRYKSMLGILLSKIPFCKTFKTILTIHSLPRVYKKEKLQLLINYLFTKV